MNKDHITEVKKALKGLAKHITFNAKDGILYMAADTKNVIQALDVLKEQLGYDMFIDMFGSDYLYKTKRFEISYILLNMVANIRCVIQVQIQEDEHMPTALGVFSASMWYEREIWDMYGVIFKDNDDLRRILTDYGFEGHPQRKDFPVTGYVEVRYDESVGRIKYEPVQLDQAFRDFDFSSPWEGNDNASDKKVK